MKITVIKTYNFNWNCKNLRIEFQDMRKNIKKKWKNSVVSQNKKVFKIKPIKKWKV
jgi:hypothetical protein